MWYLHSHLVCANEFSLLAIFALPPVFCGLEHPQYTPGKAILYNSLDSTRIAGGFLCNLLRSLRRVTSPHKKKPLPRRKRCILLSCSYFLFTKSLRAFPALNFGDLQAAILIVSPVFGLRPSRAARLPTSNVPKPISWTDPPFFSSFDTLSMKDLRAFSASFFVRPVSFAIASTISTLFIVTFTP